MHFHNRFRSLNEDQKPPATPDSSSGESTSGIAEAEELLRAGDEAIRRALSTDSVQFLTASQQVGGQ